mmetsp:Transcript_42581/g.57896  ORF Transcript_42581/g.57896 Transcript_42581/m.57896 type:complete len:93 (-) Transcript_42581:652-930(-)
MACQSPQAPTDVKQALTLTLSHEPHPALLVVREGSNGKKMSQSSRLQRAMVGESVEPRFLRALIAASLHRNPPKGKRISCLQHGEDNAATLH